MQKLWLSLPASQRKFLIHYTPPAIGKIPYRLALHYLRRKLRKELGNRMMALWPRHSFVLKSFTPFVSDLDTSLLVRENFTHQDQAKTKEVILEVRKFFPFLSEINFYRENEVPELMGCMNPFELERDPILAAKFARANPILSVETLAAVFLFRMLDSDWKNLLSNPQTRAKKWRQHFRSIAKTLKLNPSKKKELFEIEINLPNIIDLILNLGAFSNDRKALYRQDLLNYFSLRQKNKEPWEINTIPSLWTFTPQLMIYTNCSLPNAQDIELEFFLGQLSWELWGIGAQFYLFHDPQNFIEHLRKIQQLLATVLPNKEQDPRVQALVQSANSILQNWIKWES